jgi:hypothetical protein
MTNRVDLHNRLAGDLLKRLVKPMVRAGAKPAEIIVLLESVALGVFVFVEEQAELAAPIETSIDAFAGAVKRRLAELRAARKRRLS